MIKNCLALVMVIYSIGGCAQSPVDEQLVKESIISLFKGMENGDSAKMRTLFTSQVTLATVSRDKSNAPLLTRESSIDDWLRAVGSPRKDIWFEEIWNLTVQIDGDFAQAWCDYAFYVGSRFSHCGVDAFQLHKGKEGWKIFHLADTRRKDNCSIPKDIQDKHKN